MAVTQAFDDAPSLRGRLLQEDADRRQVGGSRLGQDVRDAAIRRPASCWRPSPKATPRTSIARSPRPARPSMDRGASSSRTNGSAAAATRRPRREATSRSSAQLDTLDMGAPITRTRGDRQRVLGMLRFYAGMATALHGETIENSLPGDYLLLHAEGAGRRRRRDHPLERPARRHDLEDRAGAGHRLHGRAEAGRGGAADAAAAGRAAASRPACRRAWSTSCRAIGETAGAALAAHPTSTRSPSPARTSPASRSSAPRPATSSACRSSSAASRRTSSSPTPISMRRCRARRWRCSPTRARSAAPARGCSSSSKILRRVRRPRRRLRQEAARRQRARSGHADRAAGLGAAARPRHRLSRDRPAGGRPALAGGERLTEGALAKGYFVPPTVFANVADDMRIAAGGDLRTGDLRHPVHRHRRGDRARQRHDLRSRQRRVDARRRQGAPAGKGSFAPARSGSTAIRRWIRRCRSAATR